MQADARRDADDAVRVILRPDRPGDVTSVAVAVGLWAVREALELDDIQIGMRRVDAGVDDVGVDVRDRPRAVAREGRAEISVDLVDTPWQHLRGGGRHAVGNDIGNILIGADSRNPVIRNHGGVAVKRHRPDVVDARPIVRGVQICDCLRIDRVLEDDDVTGGCRRCGRLCRDRQDGDDGSGQQSQQGGSTHGPLQRFLTAGSW